MTLICPKCKQQKKESEFCRVRKTCKKCHGTATKSGNSEFSRKQAVATQVARKRQDEIAAYGVEVVEALEAMHPDFEERSLAEASCSKWMEVPE